MARLPGRLLCVFVLTFVSGARVSDAGAQEAKLTAAEHQIEERIIEWRAHAAASVAFRTLDGRAEYFYHADVPFPAASAIKAPVMIELFRQVHEGKLQWADPLFVHNEFYSVFDSSPFQLDPQDDLETDLYKAEGQTRTIRELCELMITANSTLATNLIIQKLELENIRATIRSLHAENMNVAHSFGDNKAYKAGLINTTGARTLQTLMTAIAERKAVSWDASAAMVEILQRQHVNLGISAGLPSETRVVHQTGEITNSKLTIDGAIVYAPRPFVLVIQTLGIPEKESAALRAEITRILYQTVE